MHTVRTVFDDAWLAPIVVVVGVVGMIAGSLIVHGDGGVALRTLGLAAYGTGWLRIDHQSILQLDERYLAGVRKGRRFAKPIVLPVRRQDREDSST